LNARFAGRTPQGRSPSLDHEYMLYQSLLGAWPLGGPDDTDDTFVARITEYVVKAAREGKIETSWNNVNEQYEKGLTSFVRRILDRTQSAAFVESFDAMARRVAFIGALNSLVQLTLKATLP